MSKLLIVIVSLACLSLSPAARGAPATLLERAHKAEVDGDTVRALTLVELALERGAATKDRRAFGQASGVYWTLVKREGDYARAYRFFGQMAREHALPDVFASEAAAAGGYLGWLAGAGVLELPREAPVLEALDRRARAGYARALELDAECFPALLGLAIHELHTPGGQARARDAFARLNALRARAPYYPWAEVDGWMSKLDRR